MKIIFTTLLILSGLNNAAVSAQASTRVGDELVLPRLRSGLLTHLGSLSFEGQGTFAT